MELLPIKERLEENEEFTTNPLCEETIYMSVDFYKKVGFVPPWICYYVRQDNRLVGSAAFKGQPVNGTVEIAYGTMEDYRKQGIGTRICKQLVDLSLATDRSVKITARTLSNNDFSARILERNNFAAAGIVNDPEDGDVWEWVFQGNQ